MYFTKLQIVFSVKHIPNNPVNANIQHRFVPLDNWEPIVRNE